MNPRHRQCLQLLQNASPTDEGLCFCLFNMIIKLSLGLPRWLGGKESACQCRRCESDPWVGTIPWRRKWQPTLVCLPEKSHGQRSLVGHSPWGHKGSDTAGRLRTRTHTHTFPQGHLDGRVCVGTTTPCTPGGSLAPVLPQEAGRFQRGTSSISIPGGELIRNAGSQPSPALPSEGLWGRPGGLCFITPSCDSDAGQSSRTTAPKA